MDWSRASYRAKIKIRLGGATVEHELVDAPELQELVAKADARWILEVRSPRSLFARTFTESEHKFDVSWDAEQAHGPVYFIPGLVAVRTTSLPATGLIDMWGRNGVTVAPGTWLARGRVRRSENLAASLVVFQLDSDLEGNTGLLMSVKEDTTQGEPRFVVSLPPALYVQAHKDRTLQVAGLIAACGLIPKSRFFDEGAENRIADELRTRLKAAGVPAWDDDDRAWDPAKAATAIEPFYALEHR
jgi:hypothetical protein